ncbi:unnamed protein product [Rotaria magnacalcarata]
MVRKNSTNPRKGVHKRTRASAIDENGQPFDNPAYIQYSNQNTLTNGSCNFNSQQHILTSSCTQVPSSYQSMYNYNINTVYTPHSHQGQVNDNFTNYYTYTCYRCRNIINSNDQFYTCSSCNRMCCLNCIANHSLTHSCQYKCEYRLLNDCIEIST